MKTFKRIGSAVGTLALCLAPAWGFAQTNLLTNGSFEDVPFATAGPDSSYCYTARAEFVCASALPGWNGLYPLMTSTSGAWGATPNRVTDHYQIGLQNDSFIQQSVLLAGTGLYTLSWSDAGRTQFGNEQYQVSFGGNVLATQSTLGGEGWNSHSVTFSASAGNQMLTFQGLNTRGDATAFIDNVSLTSAVPEPTTWALMAGGLLGVGFLTRRRGRND